MPEIPLLDGQDLFSRSVGKIGIVLSSTRTCLAKKPFYQGKRYNSVIPKPPANRYDAIVMVEHPQVHLLVDVLKGLRSSRSQD